MSDVTKQYDTVVLQSLDTVQNTLHYSAPVAAQALARGEIDNLIMMVCKGRALLLWTSNRDEVGMNWSIARLLRTGHSTINA